MFPRQDRQQTAAKDVLRPRQARAQPLHAPSRRLGRLELRDRLGRRQQYLRPLDGRRRHRARRWRREGPDARAGRITSLLGFVRGARAGIASRPRDRGHRAPATAGHEIQAQSDRRHDHDRDDDPEIGHRGILSARVRTMASRDRCDPCRNCASSRILDRSAGREPAGRRHQLVASCPPACHCDQATFQSSRPSSAGICPPVVFWYVTTSPYTEKR